MANGAAGCGWEYRTGVTNICGFLLATTKDTTETFTCNKFRKELDKHKTTGHPFRCKECTTLAWQEAESKLAQKKGNLLLPRFIGLGRG